MPKSDPEQEKLEALAQAYVLERIWGYDFREKPDAYRKEQGLIESLIRKGLIWTDHYVPGPGPYLAFNVSLLGIRKTTLAAQESGIAWKCLKALAAAYPEWKHKDFPTEALGQCAGLSLEEARRGLFYCTELFGRGIRMEGHPLFENPLGGVIFGGPTVQSWTDTVQLKPAILWVQEMALEDLCQGLEAWRLDELSKSLPARLSLSKDWKIEVRGMRRKPMPCDPNLRKALTRLDRHLYAFREGLEPEPCLRYLADGKKSHANQHKALVRLNTRLIKAGVRPGSVLVQEPGKGWRLCEPLDLERGMKL